VLLQARSPAEALRLKPARLAVIKSGTIIAQTAPRISALMLDSRPQTVNPADYAPKL